MELGFTQELLAANVQHLGDFEKHRGHCCHIGNGSAL